MDGTAIELHPLENNNLLFNHNFNNNLLFYQYCWGSSGSVSEVMMTQLNEAAHYEIPCERSQPGAAFPNSCSAAQPVQWTELPKAGPEGPASHWRYLKETLLSPVPLSQTSWRTDTVQRKCWRTATIIPVFRGRKRRTQGILHCLTSTCMK